MQVKRVIMDFPSFKKEQSSRLTESLKSPKITGQNMGTPIFLDAFRSSWQLMAHRNLSQPDKLHYSCPALEARWTGMMSGLSYLVKTSNTTLRSVTPLIVSRSRPLSSWWCYLFVCMSTAALSDRSILLSFHIKTCSTKILIHAGIPSDNLCQL